MADNVLSGTFTGTGQSASFMPGPRGFSGPTFNAALWGTFVGTIVLQRSFDGSTWVTCSKPDLSDASFTSAVTFVVNETEQGVIYRWSCTAYTSGTVNYRLSQ